MASVIQNKGKYMNNQYKKTPTKMTAKDVFKGLLVFAIVGFLRYGLYELSVMKTGSNGLLTVSEASECMKKIWIIHTIL